ncbi:hypothetical protein N9C42_02465 [Alphaproteobacteria bacterium]|nr:hypothetical protein [Alphaproteobacteria bacterium]MDA9817002.1 hypothetical protein [Alphaproteobacteria bacterium]
MNIYQSKINFNDDFPLRHPADVMKLDRLGSFHQTRLSFSRQLIDELISNNWKTEIIKWNINSIGTGNAVIKISSTQRIYSLVVFCHQINDDERSDRVIAEKWDMTFSLFLGIPSKEELDEMSKNLKIQELGRHLPKQLTLSRANKSVRVFNSVLNNLSEGKQPDKKMINNIGYLVRTTAVYGNGKFGIADYLPETNDNPLNKPFQAEMLTVYLIRYFSIELVNYLAKEKGKDKSITLSNEISKHVGVGNATGLGMAPFLINHQKLIHKWIQARETAISRVLSIKKLSTYNQTKIFNLIERAYLYTTQWNVDDVIQFKRINVLRKELKDISNNKSLNGLLNNDYPLQNVYLHFINKISIETQEILNSIFIEPFPELLDDLTNEMGTNEQNTVAIGYKVNELIKVIKDKYSWALKIDIKNPDENFYFWYTSQAKLEPRLGATQIDHGKEKQLPFDIPQQVQNALKILTKLPDDMTGAEAMILHPEIRNIIKRVIINENFPFSEIQNNLVGKKVRPIDLLRCKLSFFGATKYDPKSNLWTRITLFQGAPLPHQLQEENATEWLFPYLVNA